MFKTLFIERHSDYNSEENFYIKEIKNHLQIKDFYTLKIQHKLEIYDVSDEELTDIKNSFFNDSITHVSFENETLRKQSLELEYVEGQFDFVQSQVNDLVSTYFNRPLKIRHSRIFSFEDLSDKDFDLIKEYLINPNEVQIKVEHPDFEDELDLKVPLVHFKDASEKELNQLKDAYALDLDDLKFIQKYYQDVDREANELELRLIATYWSDHCRHTTFNTELKNIKVEGEYKELIEHSLSEYLKTRKTLNRIKPITLMDIATINAREIDQKGLMDDWDKSKEVNAASIKVDISGEEYLLLFKNETHNHPSEIEPYGGASTCIGGCVRDPMSGRATVYQAMRITGAKNPLSTYSDKHPLKLSQRQICQLAAKGYSDYANQMGVATDYVKEYYHDGFEAKRFELGALLASVKSSNVQKLEPEAGDVVVVIGGRTGRDGLGAAIGSSQKQSVESLKKSGPEVQKGDPITERKLMRLFNNPEFTRLIKRSNDFGAGGLGVAVGELADGLDIYLDKMPLKIPLDPLEIALSESQERMAIVINKDDLEKVFDLSLSENLEAAYVADVKDTNKLRMYYDDSLVLELDRSFLNESGADKFMDVKIHSQSVVCEKDPINGENQEALSEMFSNNNDTNSLLQEGMVANIPNLEKNYDVCSFMSCGYNPFISNSSPYHAGYIAVLDAVSKIVAMGGSPLGLRMSFQEYFEALHQDPVKWGKPTAALLGAFQVMKELDYPSIGGKDSMSGTFNELTVPPTILCFAVQTGSLKHRITKEFKKAGSILALIDNGYNHDSLLDLKSFHKNNLVLHKLMKDGQVLSASTITSSIQESLKNMSLNTNFSFALKDGFAPSMMPASYLLEVEDEASLESLPYRIIGQTVEKEDKVFVESKLSNVYSLSQWSSTQKQAPYLAYFSKKLDEDASVLIPVFSGVNQELKLEASLKKLKINYKIFVLDEINSRTSLKLLGQEILKHNVLFFSDGFKQVNDLFDPGLRYSLLINQLKSEIEGLQARGGLVIGSGAGAFGLLKTGYFGQNIKIIPNSMNKHLSKQIQVQTYSNMNCISQFNVEDRSMRLDSYYTQVLGVNDKKIFLKSIDALDNQVLNLGFQSINGQVVASVCQIEEDMVFLQDMKNYFESGRNEV